MQILAPLKSLLSLDATTLLAKGSNDKTKVRALQMMLYSLGYGTELKWSSFRADGDYGGSTTRALTAFKKANKLGEDGSQLGTKTMALLVERFEFLPFLKQLNKALQSQSLAGLFTGTAGTGKTVQLAKLSNMHFANETPTLAEAKTALDAIAPLYGSEFLTTLSEKESGNPKVGTEGSRFVVIDNWAKVKLKKHKKGVWTMGGDKPLNFIRNNENILLKNGLSSSDVRIITPVSSNEGDLNAINTWDNCFMTFGMFQWTLGQGSGKGELPALLLRLKQDEPEAFEQYFGRFGIDLSSDTTKTTGYLLLNDEKVKSTAAKEKIRKGTLWAFRFWKSGLDARVKNVQVKHAVDRIKSFLFSDNYRPLNQFFIGDLITSEYGLCLLLDHHVNRPGHLMSYKIGKKDIIGQAMKKANLHNSKPSEWGTAEEQKLIKAYLPLRSASSMTHGKERAAKIKTYLDKGLLSGERFSYEAAPQVATSRGLDIPVAFDAAPSPYTLIDPNEYEEREEL